MSETDKMLYVLKNIGRMLEQPSWLQHEVYTRIFRACEIAGFTEDKRINYEQTMYDEERYNNVIETAREDGREEGKAAAKLETAKKFKQLGMSVEEIDKL